VSGARRTRLVDCNPRWGVDGNDAAFQQIWITFDCPEGHEGCTHSIPFTPSRDGETQPRAGGPLWQRTGDTFETLTLSPSIKRNPRHASREAAISDGCIPEYITESMLCAFHGFVTNGGIEFCGDSR
jgi:uncharacterized protein DUF6527